MAMKKRIAGKVKYVGDQQMVRDAVKKEQEDHDKTLSDLLRDRQTNSESFPREDEGEGEKISGEK